MLGGAILLCGALFALAARFADVLLTNEIASILGIGCTAMVLGLNTARLKLHSYSINGIAITLPIWRAKAMRNAIEDVLVTRGALSKKHRSQRHMANVT